MLLGGCGDGQSAHPPSSTPSASQVTAGESRTESSASALAQKQGTAETPGGEGSPKPAPEYKLGTGDQLQVSVFGQQDLSGKFEVDGNGNLVLPLIGELHAEGRTVKDVQDAITSELDKNFLVNPKVTVQVLNYRPFYILGEINKPGSYPYVVGLTLRQAVAIAGGYTRRAKTDVAQVIHSGKSSAGASEVGPDDPVLPGDTIEVRRRFF
jgi:polysaccharide export outer membrane protein